MKTRCNTAAHNPCKEMQLPAEADFAAAFTPRASCHSLHISGNK
jgi:hypothetical protein